MAHRRSKQPRSSRKQTRLAPVIALRARDRFDLMLFNQSNLWVERDGTPHLIAQLDLAARRELAAWLKRNARHFYLQVLRQDLDFSCLVDACSVPETLFQGADDWMGGTVLMRALEEPDV
jgi:hypothetical protein